VRLALGLLLFLPFVSACDSGSKVRDDAADASVETAADMDGVEAGDDTDAPVPL